MALTEEQKKRARQIWGLEKSGEAPQPTTARGGFLTEAQRREASARWGFADGSYRPGTGGSGHQSSVRNEALTAAWARGRTAPVERRGNREETVKAMTDWKKAGKIPFSKSGGGARPTGASQTAWDLRQRQTMEQMNDRLENTTQGQIVYSRWKQGELEKLQQTKERTSEYLQKETGDLSAWFYELQKSGDPYAQLHGSYSTYLEAIQDGAIPADAVPADAAEKIEKLKALETPIERFGNMPKYKDYIHEEKDRQTMLTDLQEINNLPGSLKNDFIAVYNASATGRATDASREGYDRLTRYYGERGGYKRIRELEHSYGRYLGELSEKQRQGRVEELADWELALLNVGAIGGTIPGWIMAGLGQIGQLTTNNPVYGNDDRYHIQNVNTGVYDVQRTIQDIRSETRWRIEGENPGPVRKALGYLYGGATSAADNLTRLAVSAATGINPLILAGGELATSAYDEAAQRGATVLQALLYAGTMAALEVGTEKISLDRLLGDTNADTLGKKIKDILLVQPAVEIGEEEASYFGGLLADRIIMGSKSENAQKVNDLMMAGYSREEAETAVSKDILRGAVDTAIETWISSAAVTGTMYATGMKQGKVPEPEVSPEEDDGLPFTAEDPEEALFERAMEEHEARQAQEAQRAEETRKSLESLSLELEPEAREHFVRGYEDTEEADPEDYAIGYQAFLLYGRASEKGGIDYQTATEENPGLASVVPERTRREAFLLGKALAQQEREGLTTVTKKLPKEAYHGGQLIDRTGTLEQAPELRKTLTTMARITGGTIEVVDEDTGFHGSFAAEAMKITLNIHGNENIVKTLGHELMEYTDSFNQEGARRLRKSLVKWWVSHENAGSIDRLVRMYQEGYRKAEGSKTYEQALDEITNDAIGALLTTEEGIRALVEWTEDRRQVSPNEQKNILGRVREWMKNFVKSIRRYLQKQKISPQVRRFLEMEADLVEDLMHRFLGEVDTAAETARQTGKYRETNESPRHSFKKGTISQNEIEKGKQETARMEPVTEITGDEFEVGGTDLIEQVAKFFQEHGGTVENPQLGDVRLTRKGVKNDLSHGIGQKKAASFAAVPEVLRKGWVVDYQINWKERGYDTAIVAAPITIGGEEHLMGVVLTRGGDHNKFYVHEVATTKEGATPLQTRTREGYPGGVTPSVLSILGEILEVKVQKADKKGTPQSTDAKGPGETSKDEDAKVPENRTAQEPMNVKRKFSLSFEGDDAGMLYEASTEELQRMRERIRREEALYAAGAAEGQEFRDMAEETEKDLRRTWKEIFLASSARQREQCLEALKDGVDKTGHMLTELWTPAWEKNAARVESVTLKGIKDVATVEEWIRKESRRLKSQYGYQGEAADFEKDLAAAWKYAMEGKPVPMMKAIEAATLKAVTKGKPVGVHLYSKYYYIREYFKENELTVTQDTMDRLGAYYREKLAKKERMTVRIVDESGKSNVDAAYRALSERAPELAADVQGMTQEEKVEAIWEALDDIYESRKMSPFAEYGAVQEAARKETVKVARRILTDAARQGWSQTKDQKKEAWEKAREMRHEIYETEERAAAGLRELRQREKELREQRYQRTRELEAQRRESRKEGREPTEDTPYMGNEIQAAREQIEQLRGLLNASENRAAVAMRTNSKRLEAAYSHEQEQLDKAAARIQRMDERFQEFRDRRRDREETVRVRRRLTKTVNRIIRMVTENSPKQHVPAPLRATLAELAMSVDMFSRSAHTQGELKKMDIRYKQALSALQSVLKNELKDAEGGLTMMDGIILDLPAETKEKLEKLFAAVDENINKWAAQKKEMEAAGRESYLWGMGLEDLENLDGVLQNIIKAIRDSNLMLSDQRGANIREIGAATVKELKAMGELKGGGKLREWARKADWDQLTPVYAFARYGEAAKPIWNSLVRGQGKLARNLQVIHEFSQKTFTQKEAEAWEKEVHEFEIADGKTIRMSAAMLMSIRAHLKRKQSTGHIEVGGIRIGRFDDGGKPGGGTEHYHVSLEMAADWTSKLTERQKEVTDSLQRFMSTTGSQWGNEVTAKRHGNHGFSETNYFPIEVDSNETMTREKSGDRGLYRLLNQPFTKPTNPKAENALVIHSIFDVYTDHMSEMAKYNALALPVLDAMKWYNYQEVTVTKEGENNKQRDSETVKGAIESALGKNGQKYFLKLIEDLNGATVGEHSTIGGLAQKIMARYKTASVGFNSRVTRLQGTSYFRASYVLDERALAKGFDRKLRDDSLAHETEDMLAHCDEAVWKSLGFRDTNVGPGMRKLIRQGYSRKDKLVERSMRGPEKADRKTWTRLWIACKYQAMMETGKGYGTPESKTRAAELFSEVIYKTQVMDSVLTRSQGMREGNTYSVAVSAFMSEPTVAINIVRDAASRHNLDKRRYGPKEAFRRNWRIGLKALEAYAVNSIIAALVESISDAQRDDDEYKTFLEKYLDALLGDYILDGNLFGELNPASKIVGLKDLWSLIMGYDVNRMEMAAIAQGLEVVKAWSEYIGIKTGRVESPTKATNYGRTTEWGMVYDTLKFLSQFTGLPVSNLAREGESAYNTAATLYNDLYGTANGKKLPMLSAWKGASKSSIERAYKAGYLTRDEATKEILETLKKSNGGKYTENDAWWLLHKWETGLSTTQTLDMAVLTGDALVMEDTLQMLVDHTDGLTSETDRKNARDSYMKASILRLYKEGLLHEDQKNKVYDGQSLTKDRAQNLLEGWLGLEDTEIYELLSQKEYEAENGTEEGFTVYRALFDAMRSGQDLKPHYNALVAEGYSLEDLKSKAQSQVKQWYEEGQIDRTEAEKLLKRYFDMKDRKELTELFERADYAARTGSEKGYSAYSGVYSIVAKGGDLSSEIRRMEQNGWTEEEVREAAVSEVRRLTVGRNLEEGEKEISLEQAERLLVKYGRIRENGELRELEEEEVFWKMEEYRYYRENRNKAPEEVKEWSKMSKWYEAVESGKKLKETALWYQEHDVKASVLKTQLTKHYKEQFVTLYYSDKAACTNLKARILTAVDALGYNRFDMEDAISGWIDEAEEQRKN